MSENAIFRPNNRSSSGILETCTVKPVYIAHLRCRAKVCIVLRCAMYRGVKKVVFLKWCMGLVCNVDECALQRGVQSNRFYCSNFEITFDTSQVKWNDNMQIVSTADNLLKI